MSKRTPSGSRGGGAPGARLHDGRGRIYFYGPEANISFFVARFARDSFLKPNIKNKYV